MRYFFAFLAATACGCASFSTLKTARAIDQGTSQVSVAVGAIGVSLPANSPDNGTRKDLLQVDPQFELAARYGIADGFDLGIKVWSLGGELNSTVSLVRSASFDLALAPSVGVINYQYTDQVSQNTTSVIEVFGKLPLLFGLRFGPHNEEELVFGPELVGVSVAAGDDYGNTTYSSGGALLGGTVGVSFKVNRFLRVMPEFTALTPISSFPTPAGEPGDQVIQHWGDSGSIFYQAALGFSWGDDGFEHPRYYEPARPRYYAPPPGNYPPPPPAAPYRSDD